MDSLEGKQKEREGEKGKLNKVNWERTNGREREGDKETTDYLNTCTHFGTEGNLGKPNSY